MAAGAAPASALARRLSLGCYAALVLVLSLQIFGIGKLELAARAFLWVLWTGPLLVFLPGLLRGTWKTYLWLCFVLLVYFMVVVGNLFGPGAGPADWLQLALICVLFNTAMFYARWRQRELAGQGA
jgi:uncharacterized membrane protein